MFRKLRKLYDLIFHCRLNILKTIYFNFVVFPFKVAIHFPVFLFNKVDIVHIYRGCIQLTGPVYPGIVRFGGGDETYLVSHCHTFVSYIKILGQLICGNWITLSNGICLYVGPKATLTIEDEVWANANFKLFCEQEIKIGRQARFSWDIQVMDSNFHYVSHNGIIHRKSAPIILGHNCWIGNRVNVSKGTVLPPSSIVASNSLINKNFGENEPGGTYVGSPAKLVATGSQRLLGTAIENVIDEMLADGVTSVKLDDVMQRMRINNQ